MFGGFVVCAVPFFKVGELFAQGFDVCASVGERFDGFAVLFVEGFGFVQDFRHGFDFPAAQAVGKRVAENVFAVAGGDKLYEAAFFDLAVEVAECGQRVLVVGQAGEGFVAGLGGVFEGRRKRGYRAERMVLVGGCLQEG